ncbi:MAG: right-handed parallel beta-helix repeat-containing protein [Ferruginibacter sp.]
MSIMIALKKYVLLLVCFLFFYHANATIRYVIENYNSNGSSWASASGDLQQMIALSVSGDEIWVRYGTYKPSALADRFQSFVLKEGVKIYGGFIGLETAINQRFIGAVGGETYLSGDVDVAGNFDCFHVVRSPLNNSTITSATLIDGFIITGGRADFLDPETPDIATQRGGAVYLTGNASPVFANCTFTNNTSYFGAVFVDGINSSPQFNACSFYGNQVVSSGIITATDVALYAGNFTATGCSFENTIPDKFSILAQDYAPSIAPHMVQFYRCTFKHGNNGGIGILAADTVRMSSCVFLGANTGINSNPRIGGVYFYLDISNSTFYKYNIRDFEGDRCTIRNCIVQEAYVRQEHDDDATPGITHNIFKFYSMQSNYTCYNCPGTNGDADPIFVDSNDPDGADNILGTADDGLRLYSNSPAVKQGMFVDGVLKDITGVDYDNPGNIGAYDGAVCYNGGITRLYVNASVSGGDGSGSSWANAMPNLRYALNAASACSSIAQIWVAAGTYKTSVINDREQSFYLRDGLTLYGGFAGTENNLTRRNWKINRTILSGDIDAAGTNDAKTVLFNRLVNNAAVIDGFIITGGWGDDASTGGGIRNVSAHPTIINCVIKGNYAEGYGGGMYNGNSDPTIINCSFFKNSSAQGGGAIFNSTGSGPSIRNCVFAGNYSGAGYGGAIYNVLNGSNCKLINCTVLGNFDALGAGGIYNYFASPVITNSIVWGNAGGQIVNGSSSNPTVTYSHIQGGYSPCTNCTNAALSPKFIDSSMANGPQGQSAQEGYDGMFGTVDDGLQLQLSSPCIDAGNDAVVVDASDISGDDRITGTHVNLGAYETVPIMSVQSGDWNTGITWNTGTVPTVADRVIINPTHTVTAGDSYCKSIWIRNDPTKTGGHLVVPAAGVLKLKE